MLTQYDWHRQAVLKKNFAKGDKHRTIWRLQLFNSNKVLIAFKSAGAGYREWCIEYDNKTWIVFYRAKESAEFDEVAKVTGGTTPNLETRKEDAFTLAMAMVTSMEECCNRCDYPHLLNIAKLAEDNTAYGN